jgi:hypothetical protein
MRSRSPKDEKKDLGHNRGKSRSVPVSSGMEVQDCMTAVQLMGSTASLATELRWRVAINSRRNL